MVLSTWRCRFGISLQSQAAWDSLLVKHQTHDWKVVSSNPSRSGERIFFSRVNILCWLLFGVCSIPMLLQWHVKDPCHSTKSAGGRLRLSMRISLTQRSRSGLTMPLSRHKCVNLSRNELTRNLSGNIRPQSSQLSEPLWTDPGLKSGISARELISTSKKKKKKKSRRGMNSLTFSPNPRKQGKSHHQLERQTRSSGKYK